MYVYNYRYAAIIFAVSNTMAQIPGFVAPAIVGALTPNVSLTHIEDFTRDNFIINLLIEPLVSLINLI